MNQIDPFDTEKKPLVIYHDNCLDGFTAAWIFYNKYGDGVELIPGQYQAQEIPDVSNRHVFLVDFSYPKAVVIQILEQCKSLTIWDHHKSAIENLKDIRDPKLFTDFDINSSGARITWDNLYPDKPTPDIIAYTQDRDLWKFELNKSKEYNEGLFALPRSFLMWDKTFYNEPKSTDEMITRGTTLLEKFNTDLERLLTDSVSYGMLDGHVIPCVNLPGMYASEAGNRLSRASPLALIYHIKNDELIVSLRSNKDNPDHVDVSEIAKFFEGGGHKHAAGFKIKGHFAILSFLSAHMWEAFNTNQINKI